MHNSYALIKKILPHCCVIPTLEPESAPVSILHPQHSNMATKNDKYSQLSCSSSPDFQTYTPDTYYSESTLIVKQCSVLSCLFLPNFVLLSLHCWF